MNKFLITLIVMKGLESREFSVILNGVTTLGFSSLVVNVSKTN